MLALNNIRIDMLLSGCMRYPLATRSVVGGIWTATDGRESLRTALSVVTSWHSGLVSELVSLDFFQWKRYYKAALYILVACS